VSDDEYPTIVSLPRSLPPVRATVFSREDLAALCDVLGYAPEEMLRIVVEHDTVEVTLAPDERTGTVVTVRHRVI
jgi:hypothetical protein